jgi:ATP-binding cassette subfamily B protein
VKNPVHETPNNEKLPSTINGRIEFKNVHFYYPSRPETQVLNGLNLVIEAHSRVALVGESGAGKSTLLELLMRIYDPQEGQILLDGVDIKNIEPKEICKHIGYMPQQDFLASGTVWDNICYGDPSATEASVAEAVERAYAKDFIEALPQGLHTNLGEVGSRLSGGQRQRISLARAILKNPQIVLFDEANSGLDAKSEAYVDDAMQKLSAQSKMTVLSVTHKMASARESDYIAVLSKGTIADVGTHNQLIQRCSIYKKLAGIQPLDDVKEVVEKTIFNAVGV